MSTDEQHNRPGDRSPQTEEPVEQSPVEEQVPADPTAQPQQPEESAGGVRSGEETDVAAAEQGAPVEPAVPSGSTAPAGPTTSDPAVEEPPQHTAEGAGTGDPATPAAAVDETHVALPAQRHDDPFSEVDGGEPDASQQPTTAFPTPEEDAALRDERARRFGRPRPESDPDHEAGAPQPAEEETTQVPSTAAGAGAVATVGTAEAGVTQEPAQTQTQTMPATTPEEEDPFKDFDEGPASRAAAHWWSILISIVFVPLAWYLVADGGERMSWNLTNGQPFNWAGPAELAGGALCLFFVLLAARWSSVGAILVGSVGALAGIAFIIFNAEAMELVAQYQGTLVQALNQLGQNIVDHLLADARSGRLAIYGIALIMVGVVSHGARRQGRREERRKAAIGA